MSAKKGNKKIQFGQHKSQLNTTIQKTYGQIRHTQMSRSPLKKVTATFGMLVDTMTARSTYDYVKSDLEPFTTGSLNLRYTWHNYFGQRFKKPLSNRTLQKLWTQAICSNKSENNNSCHKRP